MASDQKKIKEIGRSQSMPSGSSRPEPKSSTLPANLRPIPMSSGEGFFTKLKRCLRFGSKGRYNVSAQHETLQVQPLSVPTNSLMERQAQNPVSRATSLRLARRAHRDKEDVILIHKGRVASENGNMYWNSGVGETIHEDREQTVVHIVNGGTPVSVVEPAGAAAAADDVEDILEMDPGYETLEEIRRKVKLQALQKQQSALGNNTGVTVSNTGDLDEVKDCVPAADNGQDSGITTPTTESPESGRDGQMHSVTSSMFSESVFTEESSQVDTIEPEEITMRSGPMHRLNSVPGESSRKPQKDGQRYSSDSVLTKQLHFDTDKDLYANPKILFRKQSQMGQSKSVSASTIALGGLSVTETQSSGNCGMGEKSVSEGNITPLRGSSVESDTVPPPLPDRRYLDCESSRDEDLTADCSTSTTISANQDISLSATHDSVSSICSIREVVVDSDVKTGGTPVSSSSNSVSLKNVDDSKFSTACSKTISVLTKEGPCELTVNKTDQKVEVEAEADFQAGDGDGLSTESAAAAPFNHDEPAQSSDTTVKCASTILQNHTCAELLPNSSELNSEQEKKIDSVVQNEEKTAINIEGGSMDSSQTAHSVKSIDDCSCLMFVSKSSENISSSPNSVEQDSVQSLNSNLPAADGCDKTPDCDEKQSSLKLNTSDCLDAESSMDTSSMEHNGQREKNCSESSDLSCAQDNVVVLKLHESTHEESLTGDEDKRHEGVCDATIARLEEKAALLNMGGCGKVSGSEKDKKVCLRTEQESKDTNSVVKVRGAEAGRSDARRNSSSSASGVELPVERTRSKKRKKKEEPIHMTFAEVMSSKDSLADDEWESDEENCTNIADDDVKTEDADSGTDAAAGFSLPSPEQSGPSSAEAAHRAFLESMKQLKDCGWYWGPLSYTEALAKLKNKPDGSFLVRDSSSENYILSLSFTTMDSVCHTRIEHNKGVFSFWSQPDSHGRATIKEFIEQAVRFSHTGKFLYFLRPSGPGSPPIAIRLLYPVSRFCRVQSLQHMCRFLILRWVRRDHIDVLPVPEKVKNYLRENQYYVETLDED